MSSQNADSLLIEQIRTGDTAAWEELIERFEGRLLAFAKSRLRQQAAAEDVIQETFMGFLISLPNYNQETPLESYLFSIAAHKLTDHLRKEGRRAMLPLLFQNADGKENEPAGDARRASSLFRSQEGKVAEHRIISQVLFKLITNWKQNEDFERLKCIELLFVVGLSNKQASEELQISEQAVANHKQFVVGKLKEAAQSAHLRDVNWNELGLEK
ncbi:hypothetical protein MNBD_PLANCTO02-3388 [hydrothermal vent metagenome]|uniref:Uncharacterized protein n=1 Tax=hydrothermal vent metagenome TaxID=652676 RepID=A0A3B1E0F8_9ZZZZ